jgi:hypothetical protein
MLATLQNGVAFAASFVERDRSCGSILARLKGELRGDGVDCTELCAGSAKDAGSANKANGAVRDFFR